MLFVRKESAVPSRLRNAQDESPAHQAQAVDPDASQRGHARTRRRDRLSDCRGRDDRRGVGVIARRPKADDVVEAPRAQSALLLDCFTPFAMTRNPGRAAAGAALSEHDPEKWEPVFGKRSCSKQRTKAG